MSYEEIRERAVKAAEKEFGTLSAYKKLDATEKTLLIEFWVNGFLAGEKNMIERMAKLAG